MRINELIVILQEIQAAHKNASEIVVCFSDDVVGDRIADIESVHLCDDDMTVSLLSFEQK